MTGKKAINTIILAGGFGTRIDPSCEGCPKGLIITRRGTLLDRLVLSLEACADADSVLLVTNQKFAKQFEVWLAEYSGRLNISIVNDGAVTPDDRLGAIGDMLLASESIDDTLPTLVCASDTVFDFELRRIIDLYEGHHAFATAVYPAGKERIRGRLGCVSMKGDQVVGFEEKPDEPDSDFAAVPFYVFPPGIKQLLQEYRSSGRSQDAPGNLIPWLLENNRAVSALIAGEVVDVGTKEDIEKLK
jgi:glucose-1-phosphate thymidylyltransferase